MITYFSFHDLEFSTDHRWMSIDSLIEAYKDTGSYYQVINGFVISEYTVNNEEEKTEELLILLNEVHRDMGISTNKTYDTKIIEFRRKTCIEIIKLLDYI